MTAITNNGNFPISDLLTKVNTFKNNPASIQRVILQHLRDITDGTIELVDPTNPFIFLLEASAVSTAAAMMEYATNTRRQYPAAAQIPEDVYIHMSDKDFIDRFASPATTKFSILVLQDDLLNKMVYDPITDTRLVTIPRNSEFIVSGVTFSLQYPINIRQLSHGGIQIAYDGSISSPLQDLQTNIIDHSTRTDASGLTWLYFEFDVYQFRVNSINSSISLSSTLSLDIGMTDSYYYARVYFQNSAKPNVWQEIYTTHTDQVYDPFKPTAVLKVIGNLLNVTIPQIYTNSNLIGGTLRVDVYETKGIINLVMENYAASAFTTIFRSIDEVNDSNAFTAAVVNVTMLAYCTKTVAGGSAELSFMDLRNRVITNSIGVHNLPITNMQIQSTLDKKGYQIVKNVDVVTNRIFLATKMLPTPLDTKLITAGSASIETVVISLSEAINKEGVINNGSRVTLTPDIIYSNVNGIITMVPKSNILALKAQNKDVIATTVTKANYLYTPFYYVLDTTADEFQLRPYYLDNPSAVSIKFNSQNETTGFQVNTQTYTLSTEPGVSGFRLKIVTKSNDAFIALDDSLIHVQLSYIPVNETYRAYMTGSLFAKLSDGERVYYFDFLTNYDIDTLDQIIFNSFSMFTNARRNTSSSLNNNFEIVYSTNTNIPSNWTPDTSDYILGRYLLPANTMAITCETINLVFGYSLTTLWARSRSVLSTGTFDTYTSDVNWTYDNDVYEIDPLTGATFSIAADGSISYNLLHRKGDVVSDSNGNALVRYHSGDVKLGANGSPLPINADSIVRQVDLMFIEGAYYFATDAVSSAYRTEMANTIVSWLTTDLASINNSLLEQTKLYFYPKKTLGSIKVMVNNGKIITVDAGQYFNVTLYVTNQVYKNNTLRDFLVSNTVKTIDTLLKNSTVSISEITSALRLAYGEDVVTVSVGGLGGSLNLETLTVLNEGERCSLRKMLVKLPDNKLIVSEYVVCNFVNYQLV